MKIKDNTIICTQKESNVICEILQLWIKSKSTVFDDLYRSSLNSNDKERILYKSANKMYNKLKILLNELP